MWVIKRIGKFYKLWFWWKRHIDIKRESKKANRKQKKGRGIVVRKEKKIEILLRKEERSNPRKTKWKRHLR